MLLKVSGEAFANEAGYRISARSSSRSPPEIVTVRNEHKLDMAVVVEAGTSGGDCHGRARRHGLNYMGMLATPVIQHAGAAGHPRAPGPATRVQSAIHMAQVAEPYIRRRAIRHLEKGRIVIFAGGLGDPFFTTDCGGAAGGGDRRADVLLKGTHSGVEGVYTDDPRTNPGAELLHDVSYLEVISRGLKVMDSTAITFCMDNALPIVVFDLLKPGNVQSVLAGADLGTLVR
ncbi:MAG: UMP kinase [Acidimicrobiales bacterium]